MSHLLLNNIDNHLALIEQLKAMAPQFERIAQRMLQAVEKGGTVYWMGNGGSAADAQHLAAELIGRFMLERRSIASVALTTDSSILTCLSNDYDYSIVFSRQLEALCKAGDVVIGITTSGNSANILKAMAVAKAKGAFTLGFTGAKGQRLADACDDCFMVPSTETARIQEAHILLGHSLCEYVENAVYASEQTLPIASV